MTIVKEIADALEQVADVIKNTRSIVKAVNDGREYLKRKYPDATGDFAELLKQMQITVEGLADVTGVMQGFRFVMGSRQAAERDLVRFNNYVIKQGAKVTKLKGQIRKLKGDCEKIRGLREALNERSKRPSWSSFLGLVGVKSGRRREDLASVVSDFYADDLRMIDVIEAALDLAEEALSDVDGSLGEPGTASPHLVPRAARMLGFYAEAFKGPHEQLKDLAKSMDDTARDLQN